MAKMKVMAVLLIVVLVTQPFSSVAQTSNEKKVAIKDQVIAIPTGSMIEVKLLQKGASKIKGMLRSVTDEGFEVQNMKSGEISKVAFADVKSVQEKHGMSTRTTVLIVVGVCFLALGILFAVTSPFGD